MLPGHFPLCLSHLWGVWSFCKKYRLWLRFCPHQPLPGKIAGGNHCPAGTPFYLSGHRNIHAFSQRHHTNGLTVPVPFSVPGQNNFPAVSVKFHAPEGGFYAWHVSGASHFPLPDSGIKTPLPGNILRPVSP